MVLVVFLYRLPHIVPNMAQFLGYCRVDMLSVNNLHIIFTVEDTLPPFKILVARAFSCFHLIAMIAKHCLTSHGNHHLRRRYNTFKKQKQKMAHSSEYISFK